jgi:hypothetical protein
MRKKEVKPINSHPKKRTTKLLAATKIIIDITKRFRKTTNLST